MIKLILIIAGISLASSGLFAGAVSSLSPIDIAITPDNPFYFFKSWKESAETFFSFGAENKAKQYLHLAEIRLAEYSKLMDKGKIESAERTLQKYQDQLNRALQKIEELKQKGEDIKDLSQQIEETTSRHIEALQQNLEKIPETGKKSLENAIENSQKAIEKIFEKNNQKINSGPCTILGDKRGCARTDFNLIEPNGGEKFCMGDDMNIKWEVPKEYFDVINVTLRGGGDYLKEIKIGSFPSSYNESGEINGKGDMLWKIPLGINESQVYELWINGIYSGSYVNDVSDGLISIRNCQG
ncbi:MAG: DUF5667 domain-containing protein [Patescibacteria group bacterium]